MIPFTKPHRTGQEAVYLQNVLESDHWVGLGPMSKACQAMLSEMTGSQRALLTTSCTDALEMAGLLLDIKPGDEVIVPSYTFVSTANAFRLRGAKVRFADCLADHPNMDPAHVESLLTERTRCIVPVHYAGVACDMDRLRRLADTVGAALVEDAAQAVDACYKGRPLGAIGELGAMSFHATKNIAAGEAGALLVNDVRFVARADIIHEKGTNRSAFMRGDVDKYGWVDIGSSFLPSDLVAAVLRAQLESTADIQARRSAVWARYHAAFESLERAGVVERPSIPAYATNNAHMYYLVCRSESARNALIADLRKIDIQATFHYTPLHSSRYAEASGLKEGALPQTDRFASCLIRLPLYADLLVADVERVIDGVERFFARNQAGTE